jgi:hypothetical protein
MQVLTTIALARCCNRPVIVQGTCAGIPVRLLGCRRESGNQRWITRQQGLKSGSVSVCTGTRAVFNCNYGTNRLREPSDCSSPPQNRDHEGLRLYSSLPDFAVALLRARQRPLGHRCTVTRAGLFPSVSDYRRESTPWPSKAGGTSRVTAPTGFRRPMGLRKQNLHGGQGSQSSIPSQAKPRQNRNFNPICTCRGRLLFDVMIPKLEVPSVVPGFPQFG